MTVRCWFIDVHCVYNKLIILISLTYVGAFVVMAVTACSATKSTALASYVLGGRTVRRGRVVYPDLVDKCVFRWPWADFTVQHSGRLLQVNLREADSKAGEFYDSGNTWSLGIALDAASISFRSPWFRRCTKSSNGVPFVSNLNSKGWVNVLKWLCMPCTNVSDRAKSQRLYS